MTWPRRSLQLDDGESLLAAEKPRSECEVGEYVSLAAEKTKSTEKRMLIGTVCGSGTTRIGESIVRLP